MSSVGFLVGPEPVTLQQRVHGAARPPTWHLDKLHRVLRVRRGIKNDGMKEDNLLSLSYGRIIRKDINTSEGLLPENFEGYQIVEPGNIVMRLTDLQNDKRSLRQGLVKERGIITSAYDALDVPKGQCPEFWFYSLLALDLAKHYYSLGGGVRQSVKFTDFPNDWIYRPDLTTQRQIADFLDRETARIDLLIEKKQRMVRLLVGRLQEFTASAVSGFETESSTKVQRTVPWPMSIPDDWAVINLRQLFASADYGISESLSDEGQIAVLRMGNIQDGEVIMDGFGYVNQVDRKLTLRDGDLLFNRTNSRDLVGKVGVFKGAGESVSFASYLVRLRPSRLTNSDYLNILLNSDPVLGLARALSIPSISQSNLNPNRYGTIQVPVPPLFEQMRLTQKIAREREQTSKVKSATLASITRLREYRSALITAAVTGQIDPATHARAGSTDRQLDAMEAEGAT